MILNYINWNVSPEIFSIGSFSLRWYSLLFGLGFVLGYYILSKIFKKEGVEIEKLDKLFVYVFLGTFLGARLGHCLFYEPGYFFNKPLEILLPIRMLEEGGFRFVGFQGLASHGGAIGILIALYFYIKKTKMSFLWTMDRVVIVVALAGFFIRFGNLMNSEIIGLPTDLSWGFVFEQLNDPAPRHPAQLYEALSYLAIFVVLYLGFKKRKSLLDNGKIFGLFLILLFTVRFLIEFVKENQVRFESNLPINMGQILSIPFILLGIYYLFFKTPKLDNN